MTFGRELWREHWLYESNSIEIIVYHYCLSSCVNSKQEVVDHYKWQYNPISTQKLVAVEF